MTVRGKSPQIGKGTFLAPSADIVGDCQIGNNCSIWFHVVLRGDVMPILIGDETNIQDGTTVHGTFGQAQAVIGRRVTVGHNVILHGCHIGDLCLIGMGSVIMDHAKISNRCIVGAGSLVTENSVFPEGHLILGRPAKVIRPLNEKELGFLEQSAKNYLLYKSWYEI
ncbi:MAG: gamma carbonic anhydrase family protein [Bdellovibrionales bacterium]|nr:gamma carbonic anhydrase family protein [Bdellovibrionales bacterium]